ncbi:serine-threonine protein kinase [Streptomyces sp. S465]|uniref:serine-threonine protein kinase n=1 Tax=Streptomyces sp. S465 TaxID=2979468 RepID=UPI0022A895E9|nr:serine-threonine protein kinase [Streptomyces sp. S465]WAP55170.1 serine-threonine protein kinase [Streptomyces sp. S465]
MTGMSVRPYWELRFDADGDVDVRQLDRLLEQTAQRELTDLVVFSHGWNNTRAMATRLYDRFFAPFPELLGETGPARLGYVGVVWPSMRFADESLAGFPREPVPGARPGLDAETRRALETVFPGRQQIVARLAELLAERPERLAALDEFAVLMRGLVGVRGLSGAAGHAADTDADTDADDVPAMFGEDVAEVCERFAAALTEARGKTDTEDRGRTGTEDRALLDSGLDGLWDGAHELLRQGTYYVMKRRAGTVGREGLGPALGALAAARSAPRLHLIGHSFGGRLVSYALTGLPGSATVASVTLLQGAFSHYAFAERLPHAAGRGGALRTAPHRVAGPVVSCHSRHDTALGLLYPVASRVSGDDASLLPGDTRWGAIGYDGIHAVDGSRRVDLAEALDGPFPAGGCVSVDVSEVVRHGVPPAGAHNDICHAELAQVVLRAGRIGDG